MVGFSAVAGSIHWVGLQQRAVKRQNGGVQGEALTVASEATHSYFTGCGAFLAADITAAAPPQHASLPARQTSIQTLLSITYANDHIEDQCKELLA